MESKSKVSAEYEMVRITRRRKWGDDGSDGSILHRLRAVTTAICLFALCSVLFLVFFLLETFSVFSVPFSDRTKKKRRKAFAVVFGDDQQ